MKSKENEQQCAYKKNFCLDFGLEFVGADSADTFVVKK